MTGTPDSPPGRLGIALAQLDPVVGDIRGNLDAIRACRAEAARLKADLVVCPELVLSGYPPEDLVLNRMFLESLKRALEELAGETVDGDPGVLLGTLLLAEAAARGDLRGKVMNSAVLLDDGEVKATRFKHELPNYSVFDEKRVFGVGPLPGPMSFRGARLGVMICEDMWVPDVAECLEESGAEILVVINGSPYEAEKSDARLQLAVARVTETGLPLIYVNQVGGQDELVFDGASFVLDGDRALKCQLSAFEARTALTRWERDPEDRWRCVEGERVAPGNGMEPIYRALMLGLRGGKPCGVTLDKKRFALIAKIFYLLVYTGAGKPSHRHSSHARMSVRRPRDRIANARADHGAGGSDCLVQWTREQERQYVFDKIRSGQE